MDAAIEFGTMSENDGRIFFVRARRWLRHEARREALYSLFGAYTQSRNSTGTNRPGYGLTHYSSPPRKGLGQSGTWQGGDFLNEVRA